MPQIASGVRIHCHFREVIPDKKQASSFNQGLTSPFGRKWSFFEGPSTHRHQVPNISQRAPSGPSARSVPIRSVPQLTLYSALHASSTKEVMTGSRDLSPLNFSFSTLYFETLFP
ncbi:hypothetical protein JTE90_015725 [Oedothorax gibbosus]|uniref:Uncharacterized protein n=1 Tax=Oedothorax gibbosus TaxID=931172 RepID=A0AAV6TZH1_9ARAC|nr:hypothetical protein JTE90_015725 [Oedothorax gibbosus]